MDPNLFFDLALSLCMSVLCRRCIFSLEKIFEVYANEKQFHTKLVRIFKANFEKDIILFFAYLYCLDHNQSFLFS